MSKMASCLWFDGQSEQAAEFYVSAFRDCGQDAAIKDILRCGDAGPWPKGATLTVTFTLADHEFIALNGGPNYKFTPAISMFVKCADQAEVDAFWDRLTDGGAPVQCGWLTDRFGVSWQIVPTGLMDMLTDPDPDRSARVMRAMMEMVKLDLGALRQAYAGP
jgi:predicted 3-demethylubiquinone-9 3-methyltransferase (glyoxalase superfamily)